MKCPHCDGSGELQLGSMAIGEKLRHFRESKGLSLRAAAEKAEISNPAISQIETGKIKNPGFDTVVSLCNVYGISPLDLIEQQPGKE